METCPADSFTAFLPRASLIFLKSEAFSSSARPAYSSRGVRKNFEAAITQGAELVASGSTAAGAHLAVLSFRSTRRFPGSRGRAGASGVTVRPAFQGSPSATARCILNALSAKKHTSIIAGSYGSPTFYTS